MVKAVSAFTESIKVKVAWSSNVSTTPHYC